MHKVKIACISMFRNYEEAKENKPSVERNLNICCERLKIAGKAGVDIVCTPESYVTVGTNLSPRDFAEEIPGPISNRYSVIAAQYKMYVFGWLYEKQKKRMYNSLVLFDRKGRIVGVYRKMHLTTHELVDRKLIPGSEFTIFNTDFGTIGAVICYDAFFQESFQVLALKGAEIIFYSLIGSVAEYIPAQRQVDCKKSEELWLLKTRSYAYLNSVYVAASGCCWQSNVIGPSAEILATNHRGRPLSWDATKVAVAEVDLDRPEYFAAGPGVGHIAGRKGYLQSHRRPSCYKEICKSISLR